MYRCGADETAVRATYRTSRPRSERRPLTARSGQSRQALWGWVPSGEWSVIGAEMHGEFWIGRVEVAQALRASEAGVSGNQTVGAAP
jgi:hypothetical protein